MIPLAQKRSGWWLKLQQDILGTEWPIIFLIFVVHNCTRYVHKINERKLYVPTLSSDYEIRIKHMLILLILSKTTFLSFINLLSHLIKKIVYGLFYKHIRKVKSTNLICYSTLKVSPYKGYSPTLFDVFIQIENILLLNTINMLMECRFNSNIIYQEL